MTDNAKAKRLELDSALREAYREVGPGFDYDWFCKYSATQTVMFYIDLLPYLHYLVGNLPHGTTLTLLDAGAGSGAGAELIGNLHQSHFLGHKIDVTEIDIHDTFKNYADVAYQNINYEVADVFKMDNDSFDIVICSHVIEHFSDPTPFIHKLNSISRYFSLFYCPFEETNLLDEGRGHRRRIDQEFIEPLGPKLVEIRKSLAWRHPNDLISKCAVFALPGGQWNELKRGPRIDWTGKSVIDLTELHTR